MSYKKLKEKFPDLNWREADEVPEEDLEAAADFLDENLEDIEDIEMNDPGDDEEIFDDPYLY